MPANDPRPVQHEYLTPHRLLTETVVLTIEELAAVLKVRPGTIRNWRVDGHVEVCGVRIHSIRSGKRVLYRTADVRRALGLEAA